MLSVAPQGVDAVAVDQLVELRERLAGRLGVVVHLGLVHAAEGAVVLGPPPTPSGRLERQQHVLPSNPRGQLEVERRGEEVVVVGGGGRLQRDPWPAATKDDLTVVAVRDVGNGR